jgi:hypothetical protein
MSSNDIRWSLPSRQPGETNPDPSGRWGNFSLAECGGLDLQSVHPNAEERSYLIGGEVVETALALGGRSSGSAAGSSARGGPRGDLVGRRRRRRRRRGHAEHRSFSVAPFWFKWMMISLHRARRKP